MTRHLALSMLIVLCACHKRAGKDYFGTQVAPPGILAKIRPGMTLDQLRAIAPKMKDDPGHGFLLETPAENVKLYALVMNDLVDETYVSLDDAHAMDILTAAWGPPDQEKDRETPYEDAWRSTATGWRAAVFCGHGTDKTPLPPFCTITFHPHKPIEAMFGKAITPAAELAKVTPRMTIDALKVATHLPFEKTAGSTTRRLDFDGATENVTVVEGRLYVLNYSLPGVARAAIDKVWGPGTVDSTGATIWYDANTGWSAVVKPDPSDKTKLWLEFVGYTPFDKTIDLLVALSAFKSVDEAKAAHPELEWSDKGGPHIIVMHSELSDREFRSVGMNAAMVFPETSSLRLQMSMLDLKKEAEVVARVTTRWGAPKTTQETRDDADMKSEHTTYTWAGHGAIHRTTLTPIHETPSSTLSIDIGK